MSWFITRIELHKATNEDYTKLHEAMIKAGFKQTIPNDTGAEYKLPTAEYFANTTDSLKVVYNEAKTAADSTGKTSWIVVSQVASYWFNLEAVKK